jgi:carboxymethylenebutenolidase
MQEQTVTIPVRGRAIELYLSFPAEIKRMSPAVIVLHEIFGTDSHIRDVTGRFSAEGYVAAAPNLFSGELQRILTPANIALAMHAFATAPSDLRRNPAKLAEFAASQPVERRPVLEAMARVSLPETLEGFTEDLREVTRHVRTLPGVEGDRIGCVGFCFGGGLAARYAAADPDLKAAVIFYGQNPPIAEVPKIRAKVLGLYGGEDPGITSTIPEFAEAMRQAGKSFEYHVYPGAKHAFFNDTRPTNYHKESATDAWARVLQFFVSQLGPTGAQMDA